MSITPSLRLPLIPAVDAVVVGATTAAVTAALELRARGRSVLGVSDHAYFGTESAGTLGLWPPLDGAAAADPLAAALAAKRRDGLLFPGAIKRVLETSLLRAGVRFLFFTRPVALLCAADGRPAGLVLASRTAWMIVRCGVVVDATPGGLVARLAGAAPVPLRPATAEVEWTVFAREAPVVAHRGCEPLGRPLAVPGNEQPMTVQGYRLRLARPATTSLNQRHALRAGLGHAAIRLTADYPVDASVEVFASRGGLAAGVEELGDGDLEVQPGVWLAGAALPVDIAAARALHDLPRPIALGRRVGALAAQQAAREPAAVVAVTTGGNVRGAFRALPAFLRSPAGVVEWEMPSFPALGRCDVAVAGGGTGGAPAGIAAARTGARAVVLEVQAGLGGVGTLGLIASYWFGNRVGYTAEVDRLVNELDPNRERPGRWNPEVKLAAIHRLAHEAGAEAWLGSFACGVRCDGDRVTGLLVSTPEGAGVLETGCVVDATGSADVAAAAGARCRLTGRAHAAVQGAGLSPRSPGRDYANSDHTFIDDGDPEGVTHAFVNARAKFPGEFDTSPLADTRERRQIEGDLELSPLDFLAGRTFPDTLFTARSNFDTHGFTVHPVFLVQPPDKQPLVAHVPLRVMLPRGIDGVLVTGLGMSAHRDAIPVIRMQADVQNQGYGAGLAAAESARAGTPLRALEVKALQLRLVSVGVLAEDVPGQGDSFPLPAAELREAVAAGPDNFRHAAVLFAHAAEARPLLLEQIADPEKGDGAALVLGLLGEPAAAPRLRALVEAAAWDEGWNYRGMGQFGFSASPLDARIIALGRTRDPAAVPVLVQKLRSLGPEPAFSHCRALAIAACCLCAPELADPLHALLLQPGMRGHAHVDTAEVVARANDDWNETAARNAALRELYLARGLLACGDRDGLGRRTLEIYARDLRGVFSRHARAVLEEGKPDDVCEIA